MNLHLQCYGKFIFDCCKEKDMKKLILTFLFLVSTVISLGQETDAVDELKDRQLFLKGIYLENLKILLPWEINFTNFSKIGNPTCAKDPYHRGQIFVQWDSVTILNGIKLNLRVQMLKKVLSEDKSIPVRIYNFTTDSNGAEQLKNYFAKYTGKRGTLLHGRKFEYTRWIFNDRFVETGLDKSGRYFLKVSRNY